MLFYSLRPGEVDVQLYIYDITDAENRQLGLSVLKKKQEQGLLH